MGEAKMIVVICLLLGSLGCVLGQVSYYMDQPSGCGRNVRVGENYVYVYGRSDVVPGNPPTSCVLKMQTDSVDSKYRLEVTVTSLKIQDCAIKLDIFGHDQSYGQTLRSIGCGSKSTDTMYSEGRFITLKLSRPAVLYQGAYDFSIKIRTYSNEDGPGGTGRVNKIPVEIIVPIIVAVLLLIFVAIILCCCYRQGRLPMMQGRKPRKHGSNASLNHSYSEKKQNGGLENPVVSVTPGESRKQTNGFNPQDPIVWSTLTSGDLGKDPVTGRQRGRSSVSGRTTPVNVAPPVPPYTNGSVSRRSESEFQRSYAPNAGYSPKGSNRMYRKNDPHHAGSRGVDEERNLDSYLENKGVKIGIYPDDSLNRRSGRNEESSRKRGSYAEAQGRDRGSFAGSERGMRDSFSDKHGSEHRSRKDAQPNDPESGRERGRKGTSPSRRSSSPGGRGSSPSRKGGSLTRQGSSSPSRRRSPGEKRKSRDMENREAGNAEAPPEGKLKRPNSGFFDNPDEEGYIYSYDHLYPEGQGNGSGSKQAGESPKGARHNKRRGSAAVEFEEDEDGYLLVHNDSSSKARIQQKPKESAALSNGNPVSSDGTSYETIEMNPGAQKSISGKASKGNEPSNNADKNSSSDPSKSTKKGREIPELEKDFVKEDRYSSYDELSEPNEHETMSNPLRSHSAVKTRLDDTRPLGDGQGQPAKKRKAGTSEKKADDEISEAGSVRYGIPPSARPGNQDPRWREDSYPYSVGPSAAFNTMVPTTTAGMGPHGQSFMSAFENPAPSTHSNSPAHMAGKAAWFVQRTPSQRGPITHGAFVMQTTSRQPSQEELEHTPDSREHRPGRFPDQIPPNYGSSHRPNQPSSFSTPYSNTPRAPFSNNQHFSPIEKAERTPDTYGRPQYPPGHGADRYPNHHRQDPYGRYPDPADVADPSTSLVRSNPRSSRNAPGYVDPNISIFDEPGQRAAVMRSGVDPHSGNEVNQVVWTDTTRDPTDPPGPNPNVVRKTITRITTRAGHGDIPDPNSMNTDMSLTTYADRLGAPQPNDPAFLSPTTSHQRQGGQPVGPEPAYGQEYPGDDNVAFYLGLQGQARHTNAGSPRVHEPQSRNTAFRDRIVPIDSFA